MDNEFSYLHVSHVLWTYNTNLWKKQMEKVHGIKNVWQIKRKISLYILICNIFSSRPTSLKSHYCGSESFH